MIQIIRYLRVDFVYELNKNAEHLISAKKI